MKKIAANEIHRRLVSAFLAFKANPHLHKYMNEELQKRLTTAATTLLPLLAAAEDSDKLSKAVAEFDVLKARIRDLLERLVLGVKFFHYNDADYLAKLGPMTLGDASTDSIIRLTNLLNTITESDKAVFVWPHDLTAKHVHEAIEAYHVGKKHHDAVEAEVEATTQTLRDRRADSYKLWDEDGLDPWILANVKNTEEQFAWGRERKKRPTKSSADKEEETVEPAHPLNAPALTHPANGGSPVVFSTATVPVPVHVEPAIGKDGAPDPKPHS